MNDEAKLFARFEHASSEAKRRIGYNPKIFIRMMHEHGAISTAKRLLASEKYKMAFMILLQIIALSLQWSPLSWSQNSLAFLRRLK